MTTRRTTALLGAVVTTASLLAVVAPTSATARPAPRPDLTVTSVTAPASVRQGATLAVTTVVRNAGRAAARSTTVRFALSRDTRPGSDRALTPARSVPLLRPTRTSRATTRVKLPAATPVGTWYVIACVDPARRLLESRETNNCRAGRAIRVTVVPTSEELIEADVAAGRITEEQALVYRVFADFRDRRLPARYAGRPSGLGDGALGDVAEAWGTLPAATQEVVRPFLVPPMYAGSHWSPATADGTDATPAPSARAISPWCAGEDAYTPLFDSWDYADNVDGTVRIWWLEDNPGDAATAGDLIQVLDDKILPALTSLMGRGPRPDDGGFCDGGSAGLDISLVDAGTANVVADNVTCGQDGTTTHLVFPRTAAGAGWAALAPYLAHEVMHTIQFAMPVAGSCAQYSWLREMTAEWVQDYVTDPTFGIGVTPDDTEFGAAPLFLDYPGTPLDATTPPDKHDYGAYLLPFWAARKWGPGVVRTIWDNAAGLAPTQAVDASLDGGFQKQWDDFALANWNRGPVRDYRNWDGLNRGAAAIGPHHVPHGSTNPSVLAAHLTAKYLDLSWADGVREIQVTNDKAGDPKLRVQVVITYDDGNEEVKDLSETRVSHLCVDDGVRKATRVTLIFSNADLTADATWRPGFEGLASCGCAGAAQPGGASTAPATSAAAPGPVCTGGITFTWRDEWEPATSSSRDDRGVTEGSGTLNLVLDPEGSASSGWFNGPGSTYQVSQTTHTEFRRHAQNGCGDEVADITDLGSGAVPEYGAFVFIDPESQDLHVPIGVDMPAHHVFHNEVSCIGPQHEESTRHLGLPECAPTVPGTPSDRYWEFEETAPDSGVYTFQCSGTVTFVDGSDRRHTVTSTASGTITLPS